MVRPLTTEVAAHRERRVFERLRSDITYLRGAMRTLRMTMPIVRNPTRIFPEVIDELAERHGDRPALLSERESFSYRALAERSRRYSRWALAQGLAKGDVVALLMPNRPEYLAIWLGLTRAGVTVALLNTNLTGASLAHCIDIVAPKHVIVAAELAAALASSESFRTTDARTWVHGAPGPHAKAARWQPRSGRRSPSRTKRCSSTPPAPPECRRRRTSTITG